MQKDTDKKDKKTKRQKDEKTNRQKDKMTKGHTTTTRYVYIYIYLLVHVVHENLIHFEVQTGFRGFLITLGMDHFN